MRLVLRVTLAGAMVAVAVAVAVAALPGRTQPAEDPLVGLWAYETQSMPALDGPLTVTRTGLAWRGVIAGRSASAQAIGGTVRLVFAGGLGEFRGRLAGGALEGFWVQGAGGDPAGSGSGQAFASPVTLRAAGRDAWRGEVRPLPNRFSLYLKVFRGEDGALTAAFRNPQRNSNGGRTQFLVTRTGDAVRFASRPQAGQREIAHTARLTDQGLRMDWPDLGRPVELARTTPAKAAAYFPRSPGEPPYAYRQPPALTDGWATSRAADVGIDEAALARIVQAQIDSDPAARRPSLIHSVLVARRGKLVLEEYFFGFDRATPHDTRSAAKTFASVMLGSVMRRDPGFGPDLGVYGLLSGLGPFANLDPRKDGITLANLMTHTSGLACDDNDEASPGAEDSLQGNARRPDWAKATLDLPIVRNPGSRYAYCSGGINLLGAALSARTGAWLPELFDREVARPLQFGRYYWNLTPTGEGYAGGGAYLTARDFLKVGQAYLDGGAWRGRRVVDAAWVDRSTARHVAISPETTGYDAERFADAYRPGADGYAWHLHTLVAGGRTWREYEATGNGGQLLIVVPEAQLVVVFMAGNYQQGGIWSRWRDQIVAEQILPALR